MLNKSFYPAIISIAKIILLVMIILLLVPELIQLSPKLGTVNHIFQDFQKSFITFHILFYLTLYCCWPKIIAVFFNKNTFNEVQLKLAIQARGYLVFALVFFELLVWWK